MALKWTFDKHLIWTAGNHLSWACNSAISCSACSNIGDSTPTSISVSFSGIQWYTEPCHVGDCCAGCNLYSWSWTGRTSLLTATYDIPKKANSTCEYELIWNPGIIYKYYKRFDCSDADGLWNGPDGTPVGNYTIRVGLGYDVFGGTGSYVTVEFYEGNIGIAFRQTKHILNCTDSVTMDNSLHVDNIPAFTCGNAFNGTCTVTFNHS